MRKQVKTDKAAGQVAGMLRDLYGRVGLRAGQGPRVRLTRQLINYLAELAGVGRVVNQNHAELYLSVVATEARRGGARGLQRSRARVLEAGEGRGGEARAASVIALVPGCDPGGRRPKCLPREDWRAFREIAAEGPRSEVSDET